MQARKGAGDRSSMILKLIERVTQIQTMKGGGISGPKYGLLSIHYFLQIIQLLSCLTCSGSNVKDFI